MTTGTVQREAWGTRTGFILAAVGSAVGLGNMWRFSYVAAQGGGIYFVLLYLIFVAAVGIPVMTSEFAVGRLAQESPAKAVGRLGGRAWTPLGWLFVFCGLGILSYYSVIAGWTIRYSFDALRRAIPTDTGAYFQAVSTGTGSVVGHVLFMAITIFIVLWGVRKGLERAALILMPILFIILVSLAIWSATLTNSGVGYAAFLNPELGEISVRSVINNAVGQAFFSLSLGMGALMTYASYLKSQQNLAKEATVVALTDFGVAFTAGLIVFPIIYSFGLGDQVGLSMVGALFISLPAGLQSLGQTGDWVVLTFFVMLFFAALTSAISLLEVVVTALVDHGISRRVSAIGAGLVITLAGIPSAFSLNFLSAADQVVGNFLLIVGGFFTALLVGWKLLPLADAELAKGLASEKARKGWAMLIRYFVPPVLLIVLVVTVIPATWAAVRALFSS
ncbi:MAG: sodium-dependent transporter [Gemmatimonadales bacterium]